MADAGINGKTINSLLQTFNEYLTDIDNSNITFDEDDEIWQRFTNMSNNLQTILARKRLANENSQSPNNSQSSELMNSTTVQTDEKGGSSGNTPNKSCSSIVSTPDKKDENDDIDDLIISMASMGMESNQYMCKLCNLWNLSSKGVDRHLKGKRHRKKKENQGNLMLQDHDSDSKYYST